MHKIAQYQIEICQYKFRKSQNKLYFMWTIADSTGSKAMEQSVYFIEQKV